MNYSELLTNVEVEIRHNKSAICDCFFPFAETLELCGGFQSLWGFTCLIGKIPFSLTHALLGDFFTSFSSSTHFPGRRNDSINTADTFLLEDSFRICSEMFFTTSAYQLNMTWKLNFFLWQLCSFKLCAIFSQNGPNASEFSEGIQLHYLQCDIVFKWMTRVHLSFVVQ